MYHLSVRFLFRLGRFQPQIVHFFNKCGLGRSIVRKWRRGNRGACAQWFQERILYWLSRFHSEFVKFLAFEQFRIEAVLYLLFIDLLDFQEQLLRRSITFSLFFWNWLLYPGDLRRLIRTLNIIIESFLIIFHRTTLVIWWILRNFFVFSSFWVVLIFLLKLLMHWWFEWCSVLRLGFLGLFLSKCLGGDTLRFAEHVLVVLVVVIVFIGFLGDFLVLLALLFQL